MRQGLAALRVTGGAARLPYYLALLAEACGHVGQAAEGLTLVADALTHTTSQEEYWCEAELHRLKGDLLVQQVEGMGSSLLSDAEICFRQALTVASRQQAKALELRAAMRLSQLWQRQGKSSAAYGLLAPIYDWFTEGFDTADLQGQGFADHMLACLTSLWLRPNRGDRKCKRPLHASPRGSAPPAPPAPASPARRPVSRRPHRTHPRSGH